MVMRLWHYKLISLLPRQQLLGQHRECCALRGNGWGRKHATVDYVFRHSPDALVAYHTQVLQEMKRRGYKYNVLWECARHRGAYCAPRPESGSVAADAAAVCYPEHDDDYLEECLDNLRRKGVDINFPGD
jgi:uncharacterized protein (TIGR02328 family)